MATKINRKTPSATSREVVGTEKSTKPEFTAVSATGTGINTTSIGKRIERPTQRRGKASIAIKLRTKAKQTPKIKKKLKNKILQSAKSLENRRKLLKNGLKGNKLPKIRATIKKEKDEMPTLEPILPIVENTEAKKQVKKRTKKIIDERQLLDVKKIKIEEDDDVSLSSDAADVETNIKKQLNKPRGRKKVKNLTETVDDTINDLTFMIKKEDIKTEVDSTSESGKSDISKAKKLTRKQKIELLDYESYDAMDSSIKKEDVKLELDVVPEFGGKSDISKTKKLSKKRNLDLLKKILKKENIENTLDKMDEVDEKLIDVLDLNVGTIKRKVIAKRRHSIEKFPMTPIDGVDITISHLFNHLPRSLSPRSKRHVKARQGSEGLSRKSSPYSTRSDTPARLLRNGKQRKWIDLNLIEGLESDGRKRRRLCSDLSGSEMSVSKLSGYESDSSFSDLASSHGADNNDAELVKSSSFKESFEDTSNEVSTSVKESEDCTKVEMIDTNSNVCNNLNKEELKPENIELSHDDGDSKIKAPEKSIILDIMKQTFNEVVSNKSTTVALESVSNIYVKEEVLQTLQSVQSNNLAISACDNMADKNDSSEKKCDSQDNEQLQNVKNDSKECCREVICESEHKDGFESEITDNIESLKNIIEPSVSSSFDKLETICNFLDSADNPSELGISTACTGKPLENEQCHANPNSKGDNSFESEEFNLQLSENKEDNNENSNIDESISVPKILSMDLESQNREEKSHMTISSNENQITDAGPTEENVGISITGDLIDEAVSEPSLDIPEKESILKVSTYSSLYCIYKLVLI